MKEELLVRIYKVGCGDCIFIRVPDKNRYRHILIDCGNFCGDSAKELEQAMDNIEKLLTDKTIPKQNQNIIDLLVVTHQHWDHIKGFESLLEKHFKRIKIHRIWLSVGMNKNHPQGFRLQSLQEQVYKTVNRFKTDPDLSLNPGITALLDMLSLSTAEATEAVINDLPNKNGIQPQYVFRGFEKDLSKKEAENALIDFKDPTTRLLVLAPEKEIDKAYLGNAFGLSHDLNEGEKQFAELVPESQRINEPTNISQQQFRQLKNQLQYTALAAALKAGEAMNNTSVVLLLEWKGNRLIFPGDAEQESWNIMWAKAKSNLSKPIDFLKVSHHGSRNGTPYNTDKPNHAINCILDAILPKENAATAQAVVSTLEGRIHTVNNPVPYPPLMTEIASRVKNKRKYSSESRDQPQRTDKETEDWVEIIMKPKTN